MMDGVPNRARTPSVAPTARSKGGLFRKYAATLVALVGAALIINALIEAYTSYQENRDAILAVQREKALAASQVIEQYMKEIEGQLGWTTHASILSGSGGVDQRHDSQRLLKQAPAITEVTFLDADGKEQLKVSRLAMDVLASGIDRSGELPFKEARDKRRYVSPVYFRKDSEPYLTLAIAGQGRRAGVTVAEVNLKFIYDVISRLKVGKGGLAYAVDDKGLLISHPDSGLVLRKTDLSGLEQVKAVLRAGKGISNAPIASVAKDRAGRDVLTASATVASLGWSVFVEQPLSEAFEPIYASLWRSGLVLLTGLGLAALAGLWLAQRMVVPIQALASGAAKIGAGDLDHRIEVKTGDEVERLADSFNAMGGQLKAYYAGLERKVEERTAELAQSLKQQTASADVLRVISRAPGQTEPVFEKILSSARELCDAEYGHLLLCNGDHWTAAALHNLPAPYAEFWKEKSLVADPETLLGRIAETAAPFQRDDARLGDGYRKRGALAVATVELGGARTLMGVPLTKDGAVIGAIVLYRKEVRPFTQKQIELLQTFADQAVIAIENARLFEAEQTRTKELQESLEYQTATSEVLGVIASSPNDLKPVLDKILVTATRLCSADMAQIMRPLAAGRWYTAGAYGHTKEYMELLDGVTFAPGKGSITGRILLEAKSTQIADVRADPDYELLDAHRIAGYRTHLGVPLLREGQLIGIVLLSRRQVRPFDQRQIELVETFADQAVIAIENARLFEAEQTRTKELKESLEYQTAISRVLAVISKSPNDVQPVLDTIVETAQELCSSEQARIWMLREDKFALAAHTDKDTERIAYLKSNPITTGTGSLAGRAILERRVLHVPDVKSVPGLSSQTQARTGNLRTMLSVPLLRDEEPIGALVLSRTDVQPFSERQVGLVSTFADQAVIAIENARLFEAEQTRTRELQESLEQQTATSELLKVISRSTFDLEPVFETLINSAVELAGANRGFISRFDGKLLRFAAGCNVTPELRKYFEQNPFPIDRHSNSGRAALERRTVHNVDVRNDPDYTYGGMDVDPYRTVLAIPMLKSDELLGVILIYRHEVLPFTDSQIALIETFADQAVIAIENARLFEAEQARTKELKESLEYQTATSEVLGVISRSAFDLKLVLNTLAQSAANLCDAYDAIIMRTDGEMLRRVAHYGEIAVGKDRPTATRGLVAHQAVIDRRTIHVADIESLGEVYPQGLEIARKVGWRTGLAVPLLRSGDAIGVILIRRPVVRPFTERQIELVKTFADQAVIAIENARLFEAEQTRTKELQESLEYQTATSEVLGVISKSPSELQPVLDAIVGTAARLCAAEYAFIGKPVDGEIHLSAASNLESEHARWLQHHPIPIDRKSATGRTALEQRTIHIHDILADPEFEYSEWQKVGKQRTILGVPLLREGKFVGVIMLVRNYVLPFTERQIDLVTTFADQAVIAINNVRLFDEVQARTKELTKSIAEMTALSEVGQAVSSTLDLRTVLGTILAHACEISATSAGAVYVLDEAEGELQLEAGHNMSEELIAAVRKHRIRLNDPIVGECAASGLPKQLPDLEARRDHPLFEVLRKSGVRAMLAVPLKHLDRTIGVLLVRRSFAGDFSPDTVKLLQSFASQSSIAINNARLFREIEEKGEQLRVASLHKSQFLANMSHELRTPLNAILGYTELIQDGVYGEPQPKVKDVLGRVQTNGKHLLGLINDVLDLSKIEAGQLVLRLEPYSLADVVQTVVTASESLAAGKKLKLETEIARSLPVCKGDERRLTQVILNLVGNAIKFTDAGSVRILARARGKKITVKVVDTGPGIPASEHQKIFEEFHQVDSSNTKKKGGTGLGLAISKRIVELHGGRISVESEVGAGSTFRVDLPISVEKQKGI